MATRKTAVVVNERQRRSAQQAAPEVKESVRPHRPFKRKKLRIPKKLAEVADLYYATRMRRLAMEKEAELEKADESALREYIINNLPKSQAGGIAGKKARVEIKKRNVPRIEDERKFYRYAHRKGNEDLVKETMVQSAVQARWEAGKAVPGIEAFTIVSLSLHKLK
jgi:hypothetical protein